MAEIVPVRPLDDAAALAWLHTQPGGRTNLPAAELARRWGWPRYRITRRLQRWSKDGLVTRQGKTIACNKPATPLQHVAAPLQRRSIADALAYSTAVGLSSVAAVFSIRGMVVLFPGAPVTIVAMAGMMEAAKLVTAGWLAARWNVTPRLWRGVLAALVGGLANYPTPRERSVCFIQPGIIYGPSKRVAIIWNWRTSWTPLPPRSSTISTFLLSHLVLKPFPAPIGNPPRKVHRVEPRGLLNQTRIFQCA